MNSFERFASNADHSWVTRLKKDPDSEKFAPNKSSREVKSGHYVPVHPTPLPQPQLVALSPIFLKELDLDENDCRSDPRFVRFFSGDVDSMREAGYFPHSWATPYALAIYGTDYVQNCPFGTGNGYGDGRAISVAEVVIPRTGQRWEFQLKGGGKTPFCRGGDGRAVLRSSVREFLVSEAMHQLRISTTRAISLIVSHHEDVMRPWYSESPRHLPDLDLDNNLPPQFAQMLRAQLLQHPAEPDIMVSNPAAITCRVAPSFIRVGHIQLFERRARKNPGRLPELRAIVEHAIFREFPDIEKLSISFEEKVIAMLQESSKRIAKLTADWVRVGFCQGNFNSDNCLVAGRTMDYGPFGFVERFKPLWNMWSGGGEHFGFLNQPNAGHKNFISLCKAVQPLFDDSDRVHQIATIASDHATVAKQALFDVWRQKLGFSRPWNDQTSVLVNSLLSLMQITEADYIMFFRQLAVCVERSLGRLPVGEDDEEANKKMIEPLGECFYAPVGCKSQHQLFVWVRQWLEQLAADANEKGSTPEEIAKAMRLVSPKYVAREWILVKAYTAANSGNYQSLNQLYELFSRPYDEQPEMEAEYYRKAPEEVYRGAGKGGTAFMT